MRGRVIAILMAIARRHADRFADRRLGRGPFGPRWALGVGAASGFLAAAIATLYLAMLRHARAADKLEHCGSPPPAP